MTALHTELPMTEKEACIMIKVGLIEDDRSLNESLALLLEKEGYQIYKGYSVADGLKLLNNGLDLLILDVTLPDGLGFSIIERAKAVPVIFLTARDEEADMIRAYERGCEDYIVKPFSAEILKRRIQVVLRRNASDGDVLEYQGLRIDYAKKTVSAGQEKLKLTSREYKLLEYLSRNMGQILSKEMILGKVWDIDGNFVGDNTVSVTINRLKKKLGKTAEGMEYIRNVFGMGYVFGE